MKPHRNLAILLCFASFGALFTADALAERKSLRVEDAWVRDVPASSENTAMYLRIVNPGNQSVDLVSAESKDAVVELHSHIHRDGVMRMEKVEKIAVPAGGEARMQPGGLHVMLFKLRSQARTAKKVSDKFNFSDRQSITVSAPIRAEASAHLH